MYDCTSNFENITLLKYISFQPLLQLSWIIYILGHSIVSIVIFIRCIILIMKILIIDYSLIYFKNVYTMNRKLMKLIIFLHCIMEITSSFRQILFLILKRLVKIVTEYERYGTIDRIQSN